MTARMLAPLLLLLATLAAHPETPSAAMGGSHPIHHAQARSEAQPLTVLAPFRLAAGRTEGDLLAASDRFQEQFVRHRPGVLRRELVRTGPGRYLDIVQFRSAEEAAAIMKEEMASEACLAYFSVMDLEAAGAASPVELYPSLATYPRVTPCSN